LVIPKPALLEVWKTYWTASENRAAEVAKGKTSITRLSLVPSGEVQAKTSLMSEAGSVSTAAPSWWSAAPATVTHSKAASPMARVEDKRRIRFLPVRVWFFRGPYGRKRIPDVGSGVVRVADPGFVSRPAARAAAAIPGERGSLPCPADPRSARRSPAGTVR